MNTKNNKRHQETLKSINKAFEALLQDKELREITVMDICELAGIERSTFYTHYEDVPALANACAAQIEKQVSEQLHSEGEFAWLFEFIKFNENVFKVYFKLGYCYLEGNIIHN